MSSNCLESISSSDFKEPCLGLCMLIFRVSEMMKRILIEDGGSVKPLSIYKESTKTAHKNSVIDDFQTRRHMKVTSMKVT